MSRCRCGAGPPPSRWGGALGTGARHLVTSRFPAPPGAFPWTTFAVNVWGSLLLGAALTMFVEQWPRVRHRQSFVCAEVLGGYTTFSTLSYDTLRLIEEGAPGHAIGNAVGSLLAGSAAAAVGLLVALW